MNKNYILFFFCLINIFAISNLYSTIIRTIVLKHKTTGQQITLYGDYHWGMDDYRKKDDIQFEYIAQFIENNKENLPEMLTILYEIRLDGRAPDMLLDKIENAGKNSWKDFAFCVETREALIKVQEEGNLLDMLKIFDEFIQKMTSISTNLSAEFKEVASKMLKNIKCFNQELRDYFLEYLSDELSEKEKLELPFKDYEKYKGNVDISKSIKMHLVDMSKLIRMHLRIHDVLVEDFFDLNALCEIAAHNKPFLAVFAGDGHALNLKDILVKNCNYKLMYDSGITCQNKKFKNVSDLVLSDEKKFLSEDFKLESKLMPLIEPLENKDFDLMITPWESAWTRLIGFCSSFIAG